MATDDTQDQPLEPLTLPDVRRLDRMPSLPAWVQQRIDALGSALQPDSTGKYNEMMVLPPSMILSSSERALVEQHVADLAWFFDLGQPFTIREQSLNNDQALGVMIAHLLMPGGGSKLDEASSDARAEDYLDAIEDLPAWSVRAALRKWNRAESAKLDGKSKPHDFDWRPAPPTLRRLAQIELIPIKCEVLRLKKLLSAVPRVEHSNEHCARMQNLLSGLSKSLKLMGSIE